MTRRKKSQPFSVRPPGAVDPELFLWCSNLYGAAAHMSMPVENPAEKKLQIEDRTYAFADIPVNRGMLAVGKELHERDMPEQERMDLMMRLLHFGEIFEHRDQLQVFMQPGDGDDGVMVSEALIKACASAKFEVSANRMGFDIADLARIARDLTDAESE